VAPSQAPSTQAAHGLDGDLDELGDLYLPLAGGVTIMPVKIVKRGSGYRVSTPGGVKAKSTSKKKAEAQRRLLNAVENNPRRKSRGSS